MEVNRVTETLIFRVRDGVTLSDVVPTNASDATTSAAQVFAQLRDGVRAQSGFIHQFWVCECRDCFILGFQLKSVLLNGYVGTSS